MVITAGGSLSGPIPPAIHVGGRGVLLSRMPASVRPTTAAKPNTTAATPTMHPRLVVTVGQVCQKLCISETTFARWRQRCGNG
jgi:hypothetical protein